jgi:hypothetical protein
VQKHKYHTLHKLRALLLAIPTMLVVVGWALLPQTVYASPGDAYFTLSPSNGSYTVGNSFTLNIYETSQASDNVEGVQANLNYNASDLQCTGVSVSGTTFTYLGQDTCSGGDVQIGEASGSTVSGQQFIGAISFKVLAAGSASVSITTGSDIQNSSTQSVWNDVSTSAGYTLSNPPAPSGGSTGETTGGSSGSPSGTTTSSSPNSGTSSAAPTVATSPKGNSTTTASKPKTVPNSKPAPTYATLTVIVDGSNGKPVNHAKVSIDSKVTTYTNVQGAVLFAELTNGTHTIVITAPGKKPAIFKVALSARENKDVTFKLADASSSAVVPVIYGLAGLVVASGVWLGPIAAVSYNIFTRSGLATAWLRVVMPGL